MATSSDEYRAVEYWPDEERRVIFTVKRDARVDAMTDEELIAEYGSKLPEEVRHLRPVD